MLEYAFERYFETSGLFGTVDSCTAMVDRLAAIGVDEIACLIDFGVPTDVVLAQLEELDRLRQRAALDRPAAADQHGLAALVARHGVTHLQCTPSLARMLLADPGSRAALGALGTCWSAANSCRNRSRRTCGAHCTGRLHNMYGPTETTIWSTMHDVAGRRTPGPDRPPDREHAGLRARRARRTASRGHSGELHIGGQGVTRGYLGQEERPRALRGGPVPAPGAACTAPATWCGGAPTDDSSSSGGSTTR